MLGDAEPNPGHDALARLEELGLVGAVVTQNVDGLHQRAGSRDVIEVHGSIRGAVCLRCGARATFERVLERDGEVVAEAWTAHATVDAATHRPTRVPPWFAEAIATAGP